MFVISCASPSPPLHPLGCATGSGSLDWLWVYMPYYAKCTSVFFADLQYWIMYLPYILGPAFLLSGCIVLTLESSDPWYSGTCLPMPHHIKRIAGCLAVLT